MQVKQLAPTIDSPLSLLRAGGNFAVSTGGSTLSYFQTALDPVAAALAPRCALRMSDIQSGMNNDMPCWRLRFDNLRRRLLIG